MRASSCKQALPRHVEVERGQRVCACYPRRLHRTANPWVLNIGTLLNHWAFLPQDQKTSVPRAPSGRLLGRFPFIGPADPFLDIRPVAAVRLLILLSAEP